MSLTRKGVNASRRINAPASSGVQDEAKDLQTSQPASTILRAVVTHVLNDPTQLGPARLNELKGQVSNPEFVERAPRNSIIIRIISAGQDKRGGTPILCYPFLPSNICMPAKAGEQVWILFENPTTGGGLPYWMWRTTEPIHVDDVNYTHADRKYDKSQSLKTSEKLEAADTVTKPAFPNGGGTESSLSLKGENDYEQIVRNDPAYENFTPEPVPRFTKRPGDVALQGSNNTLIVLGEDRVGPAQKSPSERKTGAGAIDIVTGRGRFLPAPNAIPDRTSPRVIENERGTLEVEKHPSVNGRQDNDLEGNPDYIRDSSRVYLSMNSDGDRMFNVERDRVPQPFDEEFFEVEGQPFAVMKSDEVRIIARKDGARNINGSIRIIKEGAVGKDQAAVLLLPSGTVQVDAEVIYLGRPGGEGPAMSGSEPYIKFSKYKSQFEELIGIIESMLTAYDAAFAVPVATLGVPAPGLNANGVAANAEAKVKLAELKAKIDEAQSTRIFGE